MDYDGLLLGSVFLPWRFFVPSSFFSFLPCCLHNLSLLVLSFLTPTLLTAYVILNHICQFKSKGGFWMQQLLNAYHLWKMSGKDSPLQAKWTTEPILNHPQPRPSLFDAREGHLGRGKNNKWKLKCFFWNMQLSIYSSFSRPGNTSNIIHVVM